MRCAVLGGGSFGTAMAAHLARRGHEVVLWDRHAERCATMNATRRNPTYLRDVELPEGLRAEADLHAAVTGAELLVPCVPSHAMREVARRAAPAVHEGAAVCCASKGIEDGTLDTMATVLEEELGPLRPITVISGPSFARELALGLPTTLVVAGDEAPRRAVADAFHGSRLRVYDSHDVVGVCVGASLKNVMAIACGISDGLGLGHNARAAIITRGLAEITRLAVEAGAEAITLMGLAGLGDLVLTCTGDQSRNRRVGLGLGRGQRLDEVLAEIGEVAEGVVTARSARALGRKLGVEMPITEQVFAVLHEGKDAAAALRDLLGRERKHEQA
ncbi:MAG: NAD(P)-dependent glycerol-3-phosphate dehydrogenase [Alphaproteobacteria bacterium]|nr:NAD(P)-dependent glycerol-3-phosphate dehydrogenase [Alphaproteobacteria bacterium]